jgi:hypothetical protein
MKNITLLILFILKLNLVFSNELESFIDKDKTLERGNYIVSTNIKVSKNATLTIKNGVRLLFKSGTSIRVDGGLIIDGKINSMVTITSEDAENEGIGFFITGKNPEKEISISYANFSRLLIPITFDNNWYRKNVMIENNLFEYIVTGEPGLIIKRADELSQKEPIKFSLSKNNFINNNCSILIEDFESDILDLNIHNNLFTNNYFYGFELGGVSNSPISGTFDHGGKKFKASFKGNTIFNNHLISSNNDTVLQEINFGIRGRGESFELNENFFGFTVLNLDKKFDHFVNNPSAPFLVTSGLLVQPSDTVHGHIWKIIMNEDTLKNWGVLPQITSSQNEIKVFYNRSLNVRDGVQYLKYTYLSETGSGFQLVEKTLLSTLVLDKENKSITFTIKDDIISKNTLGYITVSGINDNENFKIPPVYLGRNNLNSYIAKNKLKVTVNEAQRKN